MMQQSEAVQLSARGGHDGAPPSRLTRALGLAVSVAAFLLLLPAVADARAPVMKSVGQTGGFATAAWSLPFGVDAIVVEVAKDDPRTNAFGYFLQSHLVTIDIPTKKSDSGLTVDTVSLNPGTYYLHVAGDDNRYSACPRREWSDIFRLIVNADHTGIGGPNIGGGSPACPASSKGGSGGGGGGGGGVGADKLAPLQLVRARARQDIDKLYVTSTMNEAGTLTATGSVSVPGASKVYRFKRVTRQVRANVATKLRLKLPKKSLRAVKRALLKGKRLKAKVKITAKDRAGNTRVQRETIQLKP